MQKYKRKIYVGLIVMLLSFAATSLMAEAAVYAWFYDTLGETREYYGIERYQDDILSDGHEDVYARVEVVSSDPSVVSVKKKGKKFFQATVNKEGEFTLTQKFYENAEDTAPSMTSKVNYRTEKYASPVKTFKIGKRNLTRKFFNKPTYTTTSHYSGKLRFTPKNGWKVKGAYLAKWDSVKGKYKLSSKKIGKRVKVRDYQGLVIVLKKGDLLTRVTYFSFYD